MQLLSGETVDIDGGSKGLVVPFALTSPKGCDAIALLDRTQSSSSSTKTCVHSAICSLTFRSGTTSVVIGKYSVAHSSVIVSSSRFESPDGGPVVLEDVVGFPEGCLTFLEPIDDDDSGDWICEVTDDEPLVETLLGGGGPPHPGCDADGIESAALLFLLFSAPESPEADVFLLPDGV